MPHRLGTSPLGSLLSLRATRGMLAAPRYRAIVGTVGLGYALVAMVLSGMLYLPPSPLSTGWFFYVYPNGPGPAGTYPAILAGGPYVFLDLPLISGILMTLTAAGVGLGMALGLVLAIRLLRPRPRGLAGPTAVGSLMGLTPALIGLVTLGACCSTTAAAFAGISLVGRFGGAAPAAWVANAWIPGVLQVVIVFAALVAQEQLVRVYGYLARSSVPTDPEPEALAPAAIHLPARTR